MFSKTDILEDEIRHHFPEVLDKLLFDHSTNQNIFWATDSYEKLGKGFGYNDNITPELITGEFGKVIMPRVHKEKELQRERVRDMAEVFTPAWVCNAQINLIDTAWFGYKDVFNKEITNQHGVTTWKTRISNIKFPTNKNWKDYVRDIRLEITCGEAPYITSRYDTTTGEFIPIENRIGLLDRKLRVINENVEDSSEWLKEVKQAYMSTYAFDWQGDNLLLAREAMLYTFIENYKYKFDKMPQLKSIHFIAYIISWNVWQMDGLKGVVPKSCKEINLVNTTLFDSEMQITPCYGCLYDDIKRHTGIKCLIKDWTKIDKGSGKRGKIVKFIDLI